MRCTTELKSLQKEITPIFRRWPAHVFVDGHSMFVALYKSGHSRRNCFGRPKHGIDLGHTGHYNNLTNPETVIVDNWVILYGVPTFVFVKNGRAVHVEVLSLCVRKFTKTAYHLQTNGEVEHLTRAIVAHLQNKKQNITRAETSKYSS